MAELKLSTGLEMADLLKRVKDKCSQKFKHKIIGYFDEDDVQQEVILKVCQALEKYDPKKAKLTTFLDTVIENKIKDCMKLITSEKNKVNTFSPRIVDNYEVEEKTVMDSDYTVCVVQEDEQLQLTEIEVDILRNPDLTDKEKAFALLKFRGYRSSDLAEMFDITRARTSQIMREVKEKLGDV